MNVPLVQRGRLHSHVCHLTAQNDSVPIRIALHLLQGVDGRMPCALGLVLIGQHAHLQHGMKSPTIHTSGTMNPTAADAQACLVSLFAAVQRSLHFFFSR